MEPRAFAADDFSRILRLRKALLHYKAILRKRMIWTGMSDIIRLRKILPSADGWGADG